MTGNFKEDLKLDQYALDKCALEQPELYAHWAIQWADAVNDRDRSKDRLTLAKSECDEDIRKRPREFGWIADKSPTEAFISSAISGHPTYIEANEEYMDACHEVNVLSVAKEAFEQRRKMIEVLAQLYMSNYFSGNKAMDKNYQTAIDKAATEAQNAGLQNSPRLARKKNANGTSDT